MSVAEIISELPRLSELERRAIWQKLVEIAEEDQEARRILECANAGRGIGPGGTPQEISRGPARNERGPRNEESQMDMPRRGIARKIGRCVAGAAGLPSGAPPGHGGKSALDRGLRSFLAGPRLMFCDAPAGQSGACGGTYPNGTQAAVLGRAGKGALALLECSDLSPLLRGDLSPSTTRDVTAPGCLPTARQRIVLPAIEPASDHDGDKSPAVKRGQVPALQTVPPPAALATNRAKS